MDHGGDIVALVRTGDYDRFLCIQRAPSAQRWALYAVTALHSELARIAETVSEPLLGHIRLAWWREALEEIEAGAAPRNHPVVLALAAALQAYPALLPWLKQPIEARAADLDESLLAGDAAWLEYIDRTAGALHMAWAVVLDPAAATAQADSILADARAYGKIGLLRAIPYMAQQGFLRFPHGRLNAHDLTTLAPGAPLQAFTKAMLADVSPRQPLPHSPALRPLRALARLRQLHARQLRKAAFNPFALRPGKLAAAWTVLVSI
ncbi:MAG: squalene/phytoene synthase family protein [Pseudomonadota bacterium]